MKEYTRLPLASLDSSSCELDFAQQDQAAEVELVVGSGKLGATCVLKSPSREASATFIGALGNLVLAVLGAGQLTLPHAMSELGLVFGISALVVFALLSMHSMYTLSVYELHFFPGANDCIESYADLVVRVLGQSGKTLCRCLLILFTWGGAVSFLVMLKGEMTYLALRGGAPSVPGNVSMLLIAGFVIFPLSALNDLSCLRRVSPFGCTAAIFITLVVMLCAPGSSEACTGPIDGHGGDLDDAGGLHLWPRSILSVATALPLLSFSLNSSWSYIPILESMHDRTWPRVMALMSGSTIISLTDYVLISAFGYATFCGATKMNILDSLGASVWPDSPQGSLVLLARAALAVQLTLALPMRFFVARQTMCESGGGCARIPIAAVLVGSAAGLAALPISLGSALGITSSICASMTIYILPAAIDLKLQLPGLIRKLTSVVSLVVGLFVLAGGLLANILVALTSVTGDA